MLAHINILGFDCQFEEDFARCVLRDVHDQMLPRPIVELQRRFLFIVHTDAQSIVHRVFEGIVQAINRKLAFVLQALVISMLRILPRGICEEIERLITVHGGFALLGDGDPILRKG